MRIGTARLNKTEMEGIPHYLIGHKKVTESYSAGHYEQEALDIIKKLHSTNDIVLAVGGTGLYLKAITSGLDSFPEVRTETKSYYNKLYELEGIQPLQEELTKKDPEYAVQVDLDNPHRLIRALSVIRESGQTFSSFQSKEPAKRAFKTISLALRIPRAQLYQIINERVDRMISDGLVDEVRSLLPLRSYNSLNTVGYKEIFNFLDGTMTLPDAIVKIKQHTRNYAKRQMTWFKNADFMHVDPNNIEEIISLIHSKIK